jgi:hypothetical protein
MSNEGRIIEKIKTIFNNYRENNEENRNNSINYIINNKIELISLLVLVFYMFFLLFISSKDNKYTYSYKYYDYLEQNTKLGITLFKYIKVFRIYSIIYFVISLVFIKIMVLFKKISTKCRNFLLNSYISFILISGIFYLVWNIIGSIIFFKFTNNNNCSKELYNWLYVTLILRNFFNYICTALILRYFLNFKLNFDKNNEDIVNTVNIV